MIFVLFFANGTLDPLMLSDYLKVNRMKEFEKGKIQIIGIFQIIADQT